MDPRAAKPRNVATAPRELAIAWGDGHESYYSLDDLRRRCPCATCRDRAGRPAPAGGLRVVQAPAVGQAAIERLEPVGAYALRIVWSDGHDDGIWAFEALRRDCPCAQCLDAARGAR
jgi:DUF971 family protein